MNNIVIGKLRRESLELFRKHGLTPFRNIVTPKDVRKVQSETLNKNRRARAMIPETVFWLMSFCAFCKSFADALQRLWSQVVLESDQYAANVKGPTTQAFTAGKGRDYLPKRYRVRLIRYQIPGFRPALLITNLDPEEFTGKELVGLYHERWRIETFYREIKHTLEVANLRSKRVEGIYKEIYAQLTVNNLIRYIMTEAVEGTGEATVRFSFERSYRLVHEAISKMADNMGFGARRLLRIYKAVLCEIRRYRIDWRPGRRYPRKDKRHRCTDVCGGVLKVEDDVIFYEVCGAAA